MNVYLKHCIKALPRKTEYFYDGIAPVIDGVVELPATNLHWIKRCWVSGYNLTPEGNRLWHWHEVLQEIERQTAQKPAKKSTKSVERDADEGTDAGRQPPVADGLRESESPSS